MTAATHSNRPPVTVVTRGILFLIAGVFIFSLQGIIVKTISDKYAVLEIVIVRCLVALPCLLLIYRFEGRKGIPKTTHYWQEILRGFLLFISFSTYYMGLAAIPLGDAAAIRFSAPIFVAFFSVVIVGETVGIHRWSAILAGFCGVLLIVQPGTANFNFGSLCVLICTITYALSAIVTRSLRNDDSSATMAYFSTLVYLGAALILAPIMLGIGEPENAHPSLAFLLRTWNMPTLFDFLIFCSLGVIWSIGMYCMTSAYILVASSVIAPFEYTTLPINVIWGYIIWSEIPTLATWIGASIALGSMAYIFYRTRKTSKQ